MSDGQKIPQDDFSLPEDQDNSFEIQGTDEVDGTNGAAESDGAIETIKPKEDMVHSKVPYGPWFSEAFTFYGRYFGRRLLVFGLIFALFSALPSLLFFVAGGPESEALATLRRAAPSDACYSGDCSSTTASTETPVTSEEIHKALTVLVKSPLVWGVVLLAIISTIFQLMIITWSIRTIQTGDDAWRNMKFPSVWTFPKFIVANMVYILIIMGAVFVLILGSVLLFSISKPLTFVVGAFLLFFFFWFVLRYSMFTPFILDRDFGPIAALNGSVFFLRKNILTFVGGSFLMALLVFAVMSAITIPFTMVATTLAVSTVSDPASASGISSSPLMMIPQWIAQIFIGPFSYGFGAVFYLMMTGQKRPGVWPRETPSVQTPPVPTEENRLEDGSMTDKESSKRI